MTQLKDILHQATAPDDAAALKITGLTSDSRQVKPGYLFAAIEGTDLDGRDFIPAAIENGAVAVLARELKSKIAVPHIKSGEPRQEYAYMAAKFYGGQPETVVAVTGTNGKSSTVEFLRQLWERAGKKSACIGTLGVTSPAGFTPLAHTTPDAVVLHEALSQLKKEGVTHAAMEASSHGLKQYRMDGVKISAAGFTNLTQDHFDYHPDEEDYYQSKARLFSELTPRGASVVVNVDSHWGHRLAAMCRALDMKVVTVGWAGEQLKIEEIQPKAASQMLSLKYHDQKIKLELPLAGEFQALNAIGAVALAIETGMDPSQAFISLTKLKGVKGRLEKVGETEDGAPVFVDYAHTPDGIDKLLRSVRPHTQGQIHIVFGAGGDRDPAKRPLMGEAAARVADRITVTDDNPRSEDPAKIRAAIMKACPSANEVADRAKAISQAVNQLGPKDCLVIAGKGHETGQIIGDKTIPFSDQDEALQALNNRRRGL